MHPEMQTALDNLTREMAHKHQVSTDLVNLLIQGAILRTKLAVLGAAVVDRKGKVDVKDSCEKIVTEILNLTYIGAKLELDHPQQVKKQQPSQVILVNLATEVETTLQPIINQYFLGIAPGRKPS